MRAFLPSAVLRRLSGAGKVRPIEKRRQRMNARLIALTATLALAAAAPAAASAAQVQTDQACYQDNTGEVVVTGNGFDPGQPYSVALDGKTIGTGSDTTDPTGAVNG